MALGGFLGGAAGKFGALMAANKVVAVAATTAVVAAGGATVAVTQADEPPSVEIEAADAPVEVEVDKEPAPEPEPEKEPVVDEKPEPEPEPEPEKEPDPCTAGLATDAGEGAGEGATEGAEDGACDEVEKDETTEDSEKDDDSKDETEKDEPKDTTPTGTVDIALSVTGDRAEHTVWISNLGDSTAGRVKVKYAAPDGVAYSMKLLGHTGPAAACDGWYCVFEGLAPGTNVASMTFSVTVESCAKAEQGGTFHALLDGDAKERNNSAFKRWCRDSDVRSSDLAVQVSGDAAQTVVKVHNNGPDRAGRVKVKYYGVEGGEGHVTVVSTSGPVAHCDGWYCYFEDLPVGQAVASVVFSVDVKSCAHDEGGGVVEVYAESDPVDGNDRAYVNWCDGQGGSDAATADVKAVIDGTVASHKVFVTNKGTATATNVTLSYGPYDGSATVSLVESSHPAKCTASGCQIAELAAGASMWIRVSVTVDCTGQSGVKGKAQVGASNDANADNDRATIDYGCG